MNKLNISDHTKREIALRFDPNYFKTLNNENVKNVVKNTLNHLCKDNNLPELNNNIEFISDEYSTIKASFDAKKEKIIINNEMFENGSKINKNLPSKDMNSYCLLLNLIHEFRHY